MYIKRFKIKGNNVNEITDLINMDFKTISYNPSEGIHILMSEKYYLRTNAQLIACLIVSIKDEFNCTIEIITGGGASGLLGADLGTEKSRSVEIEDMLNKICENEAWDIFEFHGV